MTIEQQKTFTAEGREANTPKGNHADFWKLCVRFGENSAFSQLWEQSKTVEDFGNRILRSDNPEITMSQAYAELSKQRDGHWYRLRAMLGGRVKKLIPMSEVWPLGVTNVGFSFRTVPATESCAMPLSLKKSGITKWQILPR